jgi:quercetin dioxygenase-like cupin family protein
LGSTIRLKFTAGGHFGPDGGALIVRAKPARLQAHSSSSQVRRRATRRALRLMSASAAPVRPTTPQEQKMNADTFETFEADARAAGFGEALVREWAPDAVMDTHTHPFDVQAVVTRGEFWLTCGSDTRHLKAGDTFALAREIPHAERYGPQGATFWVARRR